MGNILTELLPRKVRLWLYVAVALVSAGVGAWEAAEGDWFSFTASLVAFLSSSLAAGNINPPPAEAASDEQILEEVLRRKSLVVGTTAAQRIPEEVIITQPHKTIDDE